MQNMKLHLKFLCHLLPQVENRNAVLKAKGDRLWYCKSPKTHNKYTSLLKMTINTNHNDCNIFPVSTKPEIFYKMPDLINNNRRHMTTSGLICV